MSPYAETTKVPVDRTRTEIERTLTRYGATSFMYGWQLGNAVVGFVLNGRQFRVAVPVPDNTQQERSRWRAVLLVIKAKLEAVTAGISTIEDEFLAYTVLPNGQTAGDFMQPQLDKIYEVGGGMPAMLPQLSR